MSVSLPSAPFPVLAFRFGRASHSGHCAHCERLSQWDDLTFAYRCRDCGSDPVEDADASFVPFRTPAPVPAPRRAGRADRRPEARSGGPSLWSWLSRDPSPAL